MNYTVYIYKKGEYKIYYKGMCYGSDFLYRSNEDNCQDMFSLSKKKKN